MDTPVLESLYLVSTSEPADNVWEGLIFSKDPLPSLVKRLYECRWNVEVDDDSHSLIASSKYGTASIPFNTWSEWDPERPRWQIQVAFGPTHDSIAFKFSLTNDPNVVYLWTFQGELDEDSLDGAYWKPERLGIPVRRLSEGLAICHRYTRSFETWQDFANAKHHPTGEQTNSNKIYSISNEYRWIWIGFPIDCWFDIFILKQLPFPAVQFIRRRRRKGL